MPVITPLPDGSLIASQHVGAELGSPDNFIEVLRSDGQGVTWTNQGSIHTDSHDLDSWSYRGPKTSAVADGRLVMTATRFEKKENLFDVESEALVRCEMIRENFLAEHMKIAFGKPGGVVLLEGDVMTYFWCTSQGVTHTRWVRLRV